MNIKHKISLNTGFKQITKSMVSTYEFVIRVMGI